MSSREQYEKIAETIKTAPGNIKMREHIAEAIAEVFLEDNSRFDNYRFYRQCGLEDLAARYIHLDPATRPRTV